MSREAFLGELEKLLLDLPEDERRDALGYYYDYLDGADADEISERIESLGTPAELADKIKLANGGADIIDGEFTETGYQDSLDELRDVPDRYTQLTGTGDGSGRGPEKKYNIFGIQITKSVLILIIILLIFIIPAITAIFRGIGHIGRGVGRVAGGLFHPAQIAGEVASELNAIADSVSTDKGGAASAGQRGLARLDIGDASDVRKWDIEAGAVILRIKESPDDSIYVEYDDGLTPRAKINSGTLVISTDRKNKAIISGSKSFTLYVPDGMELEDADIDVGASEGSCEVSFICRSLDIDLGAGNMSFTSIEADSADIDVGAGGMSIGSLICREADIDIAMGDFSMTGEITGDLDLDCDMGNAALSLTGAESEHNYDYEVGLGSLDIGGVRVSGIAQERKIDNGVSSDYDIDVGMGNVSIVFND